MKATDVIPAVIMLALSATVALGTIDLGLWDEITPGPAFVPAWIAAIGVVLVAFRLVEAWRGRDAPPPDWPNRAASAQIGATVAGLIAFAAISPILGMIPTAALLVAFLLIAVLRRPLMPSLTTVLVTTGLIYAVFVLWLGLRLPTGVVGL
jgi:hypothetical protein